MGEEICCRRWSQWGDTGLKVILVMIVCDGSDDDDNGDYDDVNDNDHGRDLDNSVDDGDDDY